MNGRPFLWAAVARVALTRARRAHADYGVKKLLTVSFNFLSFSKLG